MGKILVEIRKFCGSRWACIGWCLFLISFFLLVCLSPIIAPDLGALIWIGDIFMFIMAVAFLMAATDEYLYDRDEISPPFFHSLDGDENHIMTDGKTMVIVEDRTPEKTSTDYVTSIEREIILFEMDLDETGKEVTPYQKLRFLKELFCDYRMDLEEYKKQKRVVFTIELDDFFSEIDLQEYDDKKAVQRKLQSIQELFRDNLIDTDEYEELKAEILEETSEL